MKLPVFLRVLLPSALLFLSSSLRASSLEGLYIKTFGDALKPALIFVHGGPGYNSHDFEVSTAQALADRGYFVVVYDQRGQGRSAEASESDFTYRRYADDLKAIIDQYKLRAPVLLGHSHGGPIALKFEEFYPGLARKIVLISAPVNFWGSMHSMLSNCSARYTAAGQSEAAAQVAYIYLQLFMNPQITPDERMGAVAAAFAHGMQCGLYATSHPTPQALALKARISASPLSGPLSGTTTAMPGFLKNEDYIHFNGLETLYRERARLCGIYGNEDGLFSPLELGLIKNALQSPGEPERFRLIQGASHGLYVDQQDEFFRALRENCQI